MSWEQVSDIASEPQPEGDYATFEWADLPATMPAHDVTVHATYTSGIAEILMSHGNVRIFSLDGKPRKELKKGLRSTSCRFHRQRTSSARQTAKRGKWRAQILKWRAQIFKWRVQIFRNRNSLIKNQLQFLFFLRFFPTFAVLLWRYTL